MDRRMLIPSLESCLVLTLPQRILILIAFFSLAMPPFAAQLKEDHVHTSFVFNGSNLILKGGASFIRSKSVVALTNHTSLMTGRALYSIPITMKSNNTLSSFSTTFVFSIVPSHSNTGGHGMAFILTPYTSSIGALPGAYLGLLNLTSNEQKYSHWFAVEFDTNKNMEFHDPNDNHVGVDISSLSSVKTEPAGYWNGKDFHGLRLKSRRNIQAWIDYDHLQSRLNVSITLAGLPRPQKPLISLKIDLHNVLQEKMSAGFSASTGEYSVEDHYVLAWSFTTKGAAPTLDISHLPSFDNMYSKRPSVGLISGITVAALILFSMAVVAVFLKRAKNRETIEEWEQEFWPHRFTYKELSIATNGFLDENIVGYGGFGKVYKGVLPSNGHEVAVKCITKEFTEGMKGFVAEISSMGRLQHRNLVQLRGWSRRHTQLFIVYDFMPNGSLDKLIFKNGTMVLPWHRRYTILKGVAAGLLYLHEEWEKRVIHRDIKSSNVLLDSEFNGRLGDFGLARLYDHSENPNTTHVVGTLGYIPPELIHTGKATPSSDVFSFGVLLLEVACGRKPIDPSKDMEEVILVDMVWDMCSKGRLLEVVDQKLGNGYDVEEMERVLKLGMLCSHPEPEKRLGMRHVCQILEGEAPLPHLPTAGINVTSVMGRSRTSRFSYAADDEFVVEMSSKTRSEAEASLALNSQTSENASL